MVSALTGTVVKGTGRGRAMGFPTINIIPVKNMKRTGVYVVRVSVGKKIYRGVANVGYAPTFSRKKLVVEAHLFGAAGDCTGSTATITFLKKLRAEKKFSSAAALRAQIRNDVARAKAFFAALKKPSTRKTL